MFKRYSDFLRKFSLIWVALFSVLLITGCKFDTGEKKRLTSDMEYIRTEIDKEIVQSNRIFSELDDYKDKISTLEDKKSRQETEKAKCMYDLGKYILEHPVIILSVTAAGSWAESVEAAARIARYSGKLRKIEDEISMIDHHIFALKQEIGLLKQRYSEYEESIDVLKAKLKEKQERYDSL
jgi:prefoldin subunit 5